MRLARAARSGEEFATGCSRVLSREDNSAAMRLVQYSIFRNLFTATINCAL